MKPGDHIHLENLTCTRVSTYERDLFQGDLVKLIWRYQFDDEHGRSYVYSGAKLALCTEGVVLSLAATVKHPKDAYGFCRLSRPRRLEIGRRERLI